MVGKCRLIQEANQEDRILYTHTSATTAWTPIHVATLGVLIPMASKDANVENSYYRKGIFMFDITAGVTVALGDPIFYNSSTDAVVIADPTSSGFPIGIACKDGTAVGGYVEVSINSVVKGQITIGSVGTPTVLTATGGKAIAIHTTCAGTDGSNSFEPVKTVTTMTGAGQVGGRVRHSLTINAAAGGWSNALKADVTYGASGRTTGLGSAFCAELTLSAGTSAGTYAPIEAELILGAGASTGTKTAFMYMAASGAAVATMDTSGVLFKLDGLTAASGKLFQVNTAAAASHALRIDIGGTLYYIMLTNTGA